MHQGNATIRERGRCKTFFMIQKNQRASASSIILCNVYFVSYHFIPNCIATTFSFTQSFLVSLVGAEKPQENSFYFLSSVLSNLNKSGGNFSSISPPGFAKTVGRRGLEWPEWRLGLHHRTTRTSQYLGLTVNVRTKFHQSHRTLPASLRQIISKLSFSYSTFRKKSNVLFTSRVINGPELSYHLLWSRINWEQKITKWHQCSGWLSRLHVGKWDLRGLSLRQILL